MLVILTEMEGSLLMHHPSFELGKAPFDNLQFRTCNSGLPPLVECLDCKQLTIKWKKSLERQGRTITEKSGFMHFASSIDAAFLFFEGNRILSRE